MLTKNFPALAAGLACAAFSASALAQNAEACGHLSATNEIFQCLDAEHVKADRALNRTWREITSNPEGPMASPSFAKTLRDAQTAWIKLRDLDCASEGKEMEGGSFEKVLVKGCLLEKTNERRDYLRRRFGL